MGKYCDQYSRYQMYNNSGIAITLLCGFLGDAVSEEKKISILKKLTLPSRLYSMETKEVMAMYPDETEPGGKFREALEAGNQNDLNEKVTEGAAKDLWKPAGMFAFPADECMEPVYEEFHKGMGELLEVLEEHAKDIKVKEPNAKNYYNFLYMQLKDCYEGTFHKKIEENAWYGEAICMTAKVAFPNGILKVNEETGEMKIGDLNGASVETILKETAGLGFIEMMMGGARLHEKEEECVNTGRVSRQELLHEYEQQDRRFEKLKEVSKEKSLELMQKNVIQNDLGEFTDGDRGVTLAVYETEGRKWALEKGYPVGDLPVFGAFYAQLRLMEMSIGRTERDIADPASTLDKDELRSKLHRLTIDSGTMKKQLAEISKNSDPLTETKRMENLKRLKACVSKMHDEGYKSSIFVDYEKRVDERMDARLSVADKTLMADNFNAMLKSLNSVDPGSLLTGSKQFKEFKTAMQTLAELESEYEPEEMMTNSYLATKKREAMVKAQEYLRYKDRQINGPKGKKHKRSELEKKRVQTVDAIYNRLLAEVKIALPYAEFDDSEKAVVANVDDSRIVDGPATDNATSFENYMKLHTGKGAMSGTAEEMVDDMAKTLAAQTLPNQNPPKEFSIDEIHKAAERIKKKFDLANIKEADMRKALENPEKAKKAAVDHYREVYEVRDYNRYIDNMRTLYARMETPAANSTAYRAVFDAVKRAASLPKTLDGIDKKKLQNMTIEVNDEIFAAIDKYVNKHGKGMGPNDDKVLHVLATMNRRLVGAADRVIDIVNTIKKAVGVKNLGDPRYVEIEHYGLSGRYKLQKKEVPNKLDPKAKAEMRDKLKTMTQTREDMKKMKEKAVAEIKAKKVDETKKHKTLEKVETKRKIREV